MHNAGIATADAGNLHCISVAIRLVNIANSNI